METTPFQKLIITLARHAYSIGAIPYESLQRAELNLHLLNEKHDADHVGVLYSRIRFMFTEEEEKQKGSDYWTQKQEITRLVDGFYAQQKMKRISCPSAIHFKLWEAIKAARAIRAITNRDVRAARTVMGTGVAWEMEALYLKTEERRKIVECYIVQVKESNRRMSCPPLMAFKLWGYAKEARSMRLISNAQVRECRDIKNYGTAEELDEKVLSLIQMTIAGRDTARRKAALQQRLKRQAAGSTCSNFTFLNNHISPCSE